MEKRRRIKFVNQVDSIHMTVTHLRWWWDFQTEGSRWQPILGESGLRQRSGLKMHTWDSCSRLWTKCYENVGSHLYEIIQFFTSLKHIFPKICPWFPGKISIKSQLSQVIKSTNAIKGQAIDFRILSYTAFLEKILMHRQNCPLKLKAINHFAKALDEPKEDLLRQLGLLNLYAEERKISES